MTMKTVHGPGPDGIVFRYDFPNDVHDVVITVPKHSVMESGSSHIITISMDDMRAFMASYIRNRTIDAYSVADDDAIMDWAICGPTSDVEIVHHHQDQTYADWQLPIVPRNEVVSSSIANGTEY